MGDRHRTGKSSRCVTSYPGRPAQPPALRGTGNEYRPKCGDALRLDSKSQVWFFPSVARMGGRWNSETVWSLVNTCQPERFTDEYRTHYKTLYECTNKRPRQHDACSDSNDWSVQRKKQRALPFTFYNRIASICIIIHTYTRTGNMKEILVSGNCCSIPTNNQTLEITNSEHTEPPTPQSVQVNRKFVVPLKLIYTYVHHVAVHE